MNSLAALSKPKPSAVLERLLRSTKKQLDAKDPDSWTIRTLQDLISDMQVVTEQLRKTRAAAAKRGLVDVQQVEKARLDQEAA